MNDILRENLVFKTSNKYDSNLITYHCGYQKCKSNHSYGPAIRDHYLIHFVTEGSGKLHIAGKEYTIKKNQGFLICPNDISYYEADTENPWSYVWIGFNGINATKYMKDMGFDKFNPIIHTKNSELLINYLFNLCKCSELKQGGSLQMHGYLYLFLGALMEEFQNKNKLNYKDEYIKKSIYFIETNYSRNIGVKQISEHVGLNRSYFSKIFSKAQGVSPEKFLINFRISKACELMESYNSLKVGDVSRSVGYRDPLVFSKIFKKVIGVSPNSYLKELKLKDLKEI